MEEDFEIIQRGLLSDVNREADLNAIEPQARVAQKKMAKTAKSAKKVNKLLAYLGNVKASKKRNHKAWLLQSLLNELGYPLDPDGYFGQMTEEQVKIFQAANGLKDDGEVGSATWPKLINQAKNKISNSKISKEDYEKAAKELGVEVAVIKAITEVEANGSGFVYNNHPKILFESHVFWKELTKRGVNPSGYKKSSDSDILNKTWNTGQKYYVGGVGEYARLQKARWFDCKIDKDKVIDAANASASWGLFQIMGNNFSVCGCKTISDFVELMCTSESEQLMLFVKFIQKNNLHRFLKGNNKKWDKFAEGYNGSSYGEHQYDVKLRKAYEKYKKEEEQQ